MYINRLLHEKIKERITNSNKAVIIYGARQVGKTTLSKQIIGNLELYDKIKKPLLINADEIKYLDVLSSRDGVKLKSLVEGYDLLFIDEAQRVPEIGLNLKILIDEMPDLKIIATGSSSFELANKVSEPLTGRIWTFELFPISMAELHQDKNAFELNYDLENILIYGGYPRVITENNLQRKKDLLKELGHSYLYKDILALANIKHENKLADLLKLLSFQIGNQVSITELSNSLNISRDAVNRYIDLLEKSFVIFRLKGFSNNLRKEVSKMDKIYFYDLGIRNLMIDNLKPLKDRNDIGQLWENFLAVERKKLLSYNGIDGQAYFWRTKAGTEIDYIEEREGKIYGFEFKYGATSKNAPSNWIKEYPEAEFNLINKDNYLDFVTKI